MPGRCSAWQERGAVSAGWKPALHDRQDACPTVTRFMESPHAIVCAHWDHERARGSSGAAVPAVFAGVSPATNPGARRPDGRRDACPTTARFMESLLSVFFRMHWDHEPGRISWRGCGPRPSRSALDVPGVLRLVLL